MGEKALCRELLHTAETGSTNDEMKKMLYAASERLFAVLSADRQTGGRGRLGRTFLSPTGGLYFSVSFPLSGTENNIPFLTLAAGLAVAEALDGFNTTGSRRIEIKWPNDIYINGKKACGILTELVTSPFGLAAVVGIGINIAEITEECPDTLKNKITSLNGEGIFAEKNTLMTEIVERLDKFVYSQRVLENVPDRMTEELNSRSFLAGRSVAFIDDGKEKTGTVVSIEKDGSLKTRTADGDAYIKFGEVTVIKQD